MTNNVTNRRQRLAAGVLGLTLIAFAGGAARPGSVAVVVPLRPVPVLNPFAPVAAPAMSAAAAPAANPEVAAMGRPIGIIYRTPLLSPSRPD